VRLVIEAQAISSRNCFTGFARRSSKSAVARPNPANKYCAVLDDLSARIFCRRYRPPRKQTRRPGWGGKRDRSSFAPVARRRLEVLQDICSKLCDSLAVFHDRSVVVSSSQTCGAATGFPRNAQHADFLLSVRFVVEYRTRPWRDTRVDLFCRRCGLHQSACSFFSSSDQSAASRGTPFSSRLSASFHPSPSSFIFERRSELGLPLFQMTSISALLAIDLSVMCGRHNEAWRSAVLGCEEGGANYFGFLELAIARIGQQ